MPRRPPTFLSALAGGAVGGAGALIGSRLGASRRLDLGAVELGFIAGAYPAMAFGGDSARAAAVESAAGGLFACLAVAGLGRRSRATIAAGLLAHAGWDALHHLRAVDSNAPGWFPAFCMAADAVLALQFLTQRQER